MEIRFNKKGEENILWKIRLLKSVCQSIDVKLFSGNGKGKVVDCIDEMIAVIDEICASLHMLLESTENFLVHYSEQIQEADNYAAYNMKRVE